MADPPLGDQTEQQRESRRMSAAQVAQLKLAEQLHRVLEADRTWMGAVGRRRLRHQ